MPTSDGERVPTAAELVRRRTLYEELMRIREAAPRSAGRPISTVELLHGARAQRSRQLERLE